MAKVAEGVARSLPRPGMAELRAVLCTRLTWRTAQKFYFDVAKISAAMNQLARCHGRFVQRRAKDEDGGLDGRARAGWNCGSVIYEND